MYIPESLNSPAIVLSDINNNQKVFTLSLDKKTTELNEENLAPLKQYLQKNPGKFKVEIPEGIASPLFINSADFNNGALKIRIVPS